MHYVFYLVTIAILMVGLLYVGGYMNSSREAVFDTTADMGQVIQDPNSSKDCASCKWY